MSDDQSQDDVARAILSARPQVHFDISQDPALSTVAHLGHEEHDGDGDRAPGPELSWSRVGRYELRGELGRGAMGEVWLGLDTELGRRVALKQLQPRSAHHQDRLRREAQALARLSHPNVVTVYGVEKDHGQLFIAMELLEGQTLQQWQEQRPAPGWAECVRAYVQAGRGLAAAHAAGLVHRDFKPSNCMIDREGKVKVLDFGLVGRTRGDVERSTDANVIADALATDPLQVDDALSRSLTQTGAVVGTWAYMAPEALAGASVDEHGDQFSFCVSLYEAVFGQRPFSGDERSDLADAVLSGRIRPRPRGSRAPSRLRRILRRGLEVDARQRWPSMEVLLVELERLVAPRTKRSIVLGSAGAGILISSVALARQQHANVRSCAEESAQVREVWNETRKQEVAEAIIATKLSYAADTSDGVISGLDGYSAEWTSMYADACEATHVRQEQDEYAWILQRECLQDGREALDATVAVLVEADARLAERAIDLVVDLPALERCADVDRLRRHQLRVPPPVDPQVRQDVEDLREQLVTVRAEQEAGRYALALEHVEPLVEHAEVLDYAPLVAEVMYRRGSLRADNGLYAESEQDLRRAFGLAIRHEHDDVAFRTAKSLAFGLGVPQARYAEAGIWGELAMMFAQRDGDPARLAEAFRTSGLIATGNGDYAAAEVSFRQALEILQDAKDVRLPLLASTLNDLGLALSNQDEHDEAEEHHRRALQLREDIFGKEHPDVAMSLNNLGFAVEGQGRHQEAEEYYRRSLGLRERALGPDDQYVANSVESLAIVLQHQGRHEEAEQNYRRVLQIRERNSGNDRALVMSVQNLCNVLLLQSKYDVAEACLQRRLQIEDRLSSKDSPRKARLLLDLAEVVLRREDLVAVRTYTERVVSMASSATDPVDLATARFLLAISLWPETSERRRSVELAERARNVFLRAGPDTKEQLARIEKWLDTHRPHVP